MFNWAHVTWLLVEVCEYHGQIAVLQRPLPDFYLIQLLDTPTGDAEWVLIDGDYFSVQQNRLRLIAHRGHVVGCQQW